MKYNDNVESYFIYTKAKPGVFYSLADGLIDQNAKCGIIIVAHLFNLLMIPIHRHAEGLEEGINVILECLGGIESNILGKVLKA